MGGLETAPPRRDVPEQTAANAAANAFCGSDPAISTSRASCSSPPSRRTSLSPRSTEKPLLLLPLLPFRPSHGLASAHEMHDTLQQSLSIQKSQHDAIASMQGQSLGTDRSEPSSANSDRSSPTIRQDLDLRTREDVADLEHASPSTRCGRLLNTPSPARDTANPANDPASSDSSPSPIPSIDAESHGKGTAAANDPASSDSSPSPIPSIDAESHEKGTAAANDPASRDTSSNTSPVRNTSLKVADMIQSDNYPTPAISPPVGESGGMADRSETRSDPATAPLPDHAAKPVGSAAIQQHSPHSASTRKRLPLPDRFADGLSAKRLSRGHVPSPLSLSRLPDVPMGGMQPWLAPIRPLGTPPFPMYRQMWNGYAEPLVTPGFPKSNWRHQLVYHRHRQNLGHLQQHMPQHMPMHQPKVVHFDGPRYVSRPSSAGTVTDVYVGHVIRPAPLLAQPLSVQRKTFHETHIEGRKASALALEHGVGYFAETPRPVHGQISLMNEACYKFKIRPGPMPARSPKQDGKDGNTGPLPEPKRSEWLAGERQKFLKVCADTWDLHFARSET